MIKKERMDLVCFSHLRWDSACQRPQQVLLKFSKECRVFYIEEPVYEAVSSAQLAVNIVSETLFVITPVLAHGTEEREIIGVQQDLLLQLFSIYSIHPDVFWFCTPLALAVTKGFSPDLVVYDCMDEPAELKFVHPASRHYEAELFNKADIVFTSNGLPAAGKKILHTGKLHQLGRIVEQSVSYARN